MADWTPNTWKNDEAPKINADNMNHLNDGISEALDTATEALKYEIEDIALQGMKEVQIAKIIRNGKQRTFQLIGVADATPYETKTIYNLKECDVPIYWSDKMFPAITNGDKSHAIELSVGPDNKRIELKFPEGNGTDYNRSKIKADVTWYVA